MKAKDYLQQVNKIDAIIKNKLIEKNQWMAIATSTTAYSDGERVQSTGSKQKMADAVVRIVEMQEEINEYIELLVDTKESILKTIENLPTIEYDILHKVYIQGMNLYNVALYYDKTYSWVTTIHGRALKHVQDIIEGKGITYDKE